MFIKEHSDIKVEEHFYRKVFGDSFKLGFHRPIYVLNTKMPLIKRKFNQNMQNTKGTKTQQEI